MTKEPKAGIKKQKQNPFFNNIKSVLFDFHYSGVSVNKMIKIPSFLQSPSACPIQYTTNNNNQIK